MKDFNIPYSELAPVIRGAIQLGGNNKIPVNTGFKLSYIVNTTAASKKAYDENLEKLKKVYLVDDEINGQKVKVIPNDKVDEYNEHKTQMGDLKIKINLPTFTLKELGSDDKDSVNRYGISMQSLYDLYLLIEDKSKDDQAAAPNVPDFGAILPEKERPTVEPANVSEKTSG